MTTVCSTGSSCGQPVPTSTKWVLTLIFCIIVIRNGLNTKCPLHSRLNFMFLVQLLIFFDWLWHVSFPAKWHILSLFLMPVIQCIVAQWRLVSSESAVNIWQQNVATVSNMLHTCSHKPWIAWDILLVIISVTGNLCDKCPKRLLEQNSSYSDYFNAISGLYRTAEPQEALWH